ncbi:NAD(P)-dependent alcohol dehydrogenase [Spirosoma pollinicola]|uniref:NAD(P)-dependent alcohol dehydrogenase n=1 Tax=Spirosoma pollinicola TaxID=2057025 RepID=A0A2K8YVF7_9BACT|nr:NAD(P)-dependent alcohol dehydrogenase [Spirosoma pollinicola]AUD01625.1 NAD(P)-dependent alcohol dehydrogenase [Spirosoma pollinicola]
MKKLEYSAYGSLDTVTLVDAPVPEVEKDTVLVRVKAASINPLDWKIWAGEMKILTGFSFPKSVGIDFAGIVERVGNGVDGFQKGDEVLGTADIFKGGAMAEYVRVKADTISHKPATLSFEQAAALPVVGESAVQIFDKLAPLKPGMELLIVGATGGIGTIAIQLAKRQGARVTAVVGTKGIELARKLGSDEVINYDQQNVLDHPSTYDVVLDLSGKLPYDQVEERMKPVSVYVSTLPTPTALASAFAHNLFSGKKREILNLKPSRAYLDQIAHDAANGLDVVVYKTYPLASFKQAYTEAAKGGIQGKIVISL